MPAPAIVTSGAALMLKPGRQHIVVYTFPYLEKVSMLKTILMTGLMVMAGIFALGLVFSIFGTLIGVTFWLLGFAIKALIIGGIAYLAIRVFSAGYRASFARAWSGNPASINIETRAAWAITTRLKQ
jgi:hypothetical protein